PRLVPVEPAEDPVAVGAGEPRQAVESTARAAVGVADEGDGVAERVADPLRPVVELGRQRPHLEIPAAPLRDLVDVQRERTAGDDRAAHPGNWSWSMNRSLKSARPDSSTYATSS